MRHLVFAICWLFIAAVSAYDAYLTALYAGTLVEQNPIGQRLIKAGGVPLLLAVKFFGTSVALAALLLVYERGRLGVPVAIGVAICQFVLLWYLEFA